MTGTIIENNRIPANSAKLHSDWEKDPASKVSSLQTKLNKTKNSYKKSCPRHFDLDGLKVLNNKVLCFSNNEPVR